MTRISTIHGIGTDEYAGRAAMVTSQGYIPYLSLTQGEMRLWLAAQRARMISQWYGNDAPQYAEAYNMIENALHAGVHGNISWMGAVPDYLQNIARMIKNAGSQRWPASTGGFIGRSGQGIGQIIIPTIERRKACMDEANKIKNILKRNAAQLKCEKLYQKEVIINNNLVNMSPHMLYKNLPKIDLPADVLDHRFAHRLGVEGIAGVGEITNYSLVYEWIENGILQKNSQGGAGMIGSVISSYYLAPDADARIAKYNQMMLQPNATITGNARIGIAPLVLAAIVSIVTGAVAAAFKYLTEIRKTEILAMSEARGFGTPEYSASKEQWLSETSSGIDTTTLLLLAAGAAAIMISDEN